MNSCILRIDSIRVDETCLEPVIYSKPFGSDIETVEVRPGFIRELKEALTELVDNPQLMNPDRVSKVQTIADQVFKITVNAGRISPIISNEVEIRLAFADKEIESLLTLYLKEAKPLVCTSSWNDLAKMSGIKNRGLHPSYVADLPQINKS